MTITNKITRADFVPQQDGSIAFAIAVAEMAPDPRDTSKTITLQQHDIMTPEKALADFGIKLSDVVEGFNDEVLADLTAARAGLAKAREDAADATTQAEADVSKARSDAAAAQDAMAAAEQTANARIADLESQVAVLTDQVNTLTPPPA
jgi:outer membrane protein TolC